MDLYVWFSFDQNSNDFKIFTVIVGDIPSHVMMYNDTYLTFINKRNFFIRS